MTIGEQIIDAIIKTPLMKVADNTTNAWSEDCVIVLSSGAAEQLEAVVEAHIEERVRADRRSLQERLERSTYFIRKDGKLVFLAIKKDDDGKEYVDMDDEILLVSNPNPH